MQKRKSEPEEAIGPAVDGLENFPPLAISSSPEEDLPEYEELPEEVEIESVPDPVILICGDGAVAQAMADLAVRCGFVLEVAIEGRDEVTEARWPEARIIYEVPQWQNIVEICGIDRNYFVCVFLENLEETEDILDQCLMSNALYLGAFCNMETRKEIFAGLRKMGAPDAELAAIACPMGLNIGASSPEQHAVGIVAELMAANAGTLKRLRHSEPKSRR